MSRTELSPNQIQTLRTSGSILENEIAYFHGDLLIVENVVTNEKRVLDNHSIINESGRRILKG
jgi:hypothetical protein